MQKRGQKDNKSHGVCCGIVSPRNFRDNIHKKVSPTRLPKLDLNKNNIYRYANTERGMFMTPQFYTKNYR